MQIKWPLLVLWLGACGSGCSLVGGAAREMICAPIDCADDFFLTHHFRILADRAWDKVEASHPPGSFSADYARGFRDGYADYLDAGGSGEPPLLPPPDYRKKCCETPAGHRAAEDWFAGFRHGAAAARASGNRHWATLAVSLPPPGAPPASCGPALEGPPPPTPSPGTVPPAPPGSVLPPAAGPSLPEAPGLPGDFPDFQGPGSEPTLPRPREVPSPEVSSRQGGPHVIITGVNAQGPRPPASSPPPKEAAPWPRAGTADQPPADAAEDSSRSNPDPGDPAGPAVSRSCDALLHDGPPPSPVLTRVPLPEGTTLAATGCLDEAEPCREGPLTAQVVPGDLRGLDPGRK